MEDATARFDVYLCTCARFKLIGSPAAIDAVEEAIKHGRMPTKNMPQTCVTVVSC